MPNYYTGSAFLYPPTIAMPDDSDPLDASSFDPGYENLGDRTAFTSARTRGLASANWLGGLQAWANTGTVNSNGTPIFNNIPVWDPCYGQWLMVTGGSTGTWQVLQSFDGLQWGPVIYVGDGRYQYGFGVNSSNAGAAEPNVGIAVRPSDGLIALFSKNATATYNQTTGAWTRTAVTSAGFPGIFVMVWFGAANVFVCVPCQNQGAPVADMAPFSSPDGVTWTVAGTWSPGSWGGNNPYGVVVCAGTSPRVAVFSSAIGFGFFATSTDGTTWATNVAMPSLLAGEQVVGACWDASLQALYGGVYGGLCILVSSSTQARLFTQGGVLQSTIPYSCVGLASNNGELVTMAKYGTTSVPGGFWRCVQSVDGGNTWGVTQMSSYSPATTANYNPASNTASYYAFGLVGNAAGQFLYTNQCAAYARTAVSGKLPGGLL